jgi:hypothetical protein
MSDPRKPQDSQFLASVHGLDARVRLTVAPDPECDTVLPAAAENDGVAEGTGAEAGRAMPSLETICSIRSRPSNIGVCARLQRISDVMHTEKH